MIPAGSYFETGEIYSVSQLTRETRFLLEEHFPSVWVEGEISNLSRPSSGHWYFTLKDESSQVRCAMFRQQNRAVNFSMTDGAKVMLKARVSLYEGRGDFQLIVDYIEENGVGALQRAFEALKARLSKDGLFDPLRKKPIPAFARCIGVVTSPTGAAIRDILTTLQRRFPAIRIIIYPVAVQGEQAAGQIVEAIQLANQRQECDLLIVARGGGSIEDLWPFNEESVARSIFASQLPIISGVGHEVDFTIADFVADQRAPTPTAAAEMCSPDGVFWQQQIEQLHCTVIRLMEYALNQRGQEIDHLSKRLVNPQQRLNDQALTLAHLTSALCQAENNLLARRLATVMQISTELRQHSPLQRIAALQSEQTLLLQQLVQTMQQSLSQRQHQLQQVVYGLDTLSPLATLTRGYAIVTALDSGEILRSVKQVKAGQKVKARLADGVLGCLVETT